MQNLIPQFWVFAAQQLFALITKLLFRVHVLAFRDQATFRIEALYLIGFDVEEFEPQIKFLFVRPCTPVVSTVFSFAIDALPSDVWSK